MMEFKNQKHPMYCDSMAGDLRDDVSPLESF